MNGVDAVADGGVWTGPQGGHLAAGADHVPVHVLTDDGTGLPDRAWREPAPALLDLTSTATA
jgi:hypothetical protein